MPVENKKGQKVNEKPATGDGIKSFPRSFWSANVMELFERGAYYGMNSVLAVYLVTKVVDGGLGFSVKSVGALQSVFMAMTYIMPILGGALAERYGYKKLLTICFSILTIGYFASGHVSSYSIIFLTLLMIAVGSGLFKPIISGTVTRTSTDKTRSLGFGIYYWMINLGAFISPIFVSYIRGFSWSYVFIASAAWCALMLFVNLFTYKEPEKPESSKSLGQTLSEAIMVLKDFRFILMIVIYSGFWLLYFQMFNTVLWYMVDHVNMTPVDKALTAVAGFFGSSKELKFDVAFVTSLNAGTIIALQVFVSKIVKNFRALPTMIVGIIIGTTGFILLSASSHAWFFFFGVMVFSIGEMTCHPKYYSYVGQIAPKDKVAVYMGYSFLYGIIGSLVGNNLGAALYVKIVKEMGQPRVLWMIFSGIGILTTIGLLLYDRFLAPEKHEVAAHDA